MVDVFEVKDIPFYIALALLTGVASVYFSKMYFGITRFFERFQSPLKRLIIGGIAIGIMLYLIPPLYGEGYGLINNLLQGNTAEALKDIPYNIELQNVYVVVLMLLLIGIFKAIAMTTTFAAGGVGGIFIPTLFMGSALGNSIAKVINHLGFSVSESNFTLIGMTGSNGWSFTCTFDCNFFDCRNHRGVRFVCSFDVSSLPFLIGFTKYFVPNSIYTAELAKRGELNYKQIKIRMH